MRELRISWPEKATSIADPVELLVELAYSWDLPAWIRVQWFPDDDNNFRRRIHLSLSPYNSLWDAKAVRQRLRDPTRYAKYWAQVFKEFVTNTSTADATKERVERCRFVENNVQEALRRVSLSRKPKPTAVTLDALGNATSLDWLGAFNKVLGPFANLTARDELIFSDTLLWETIQDLVVRFKDDIQEHLGWIFMQVFGGTSPEL